MERNKIAVLLGVLVVGLFIGYIFGASNKNVSNTQNTYQSSNMGHMMHNMSSSLEGKTGDDLNKEFLEQMIIHHQGAIEMADTILRNSNSVELKKFSQDIISVQSREINMMQNWLRSGTISMPQTNSNSSAGAGSTGSTPDVRAVSPTEPAPGFYDEPMVACTMEARMCPDGVNYVGRQGPNCEFAKCPGER